MNCSDLQKHADGDHYVVKCPRALQWFENGRLRKYSDEERQSGRFELFLDLLCTFTFPSLFLPTRARTHTSHHGD